MKVGLNELSSNCLILGRIHEFFTGKVREVSALQNGGIRHLKYNRRKLKHNNRENRRYTKRPNINQLLPCETNRDACVYNNMHYAITVYMDESSEFVVIDKSKTFGATICNSFHIALLLYTGVASFTSEHIVISSIVWIMKWLQHWPMHSLVMRIVYIYLF